MCILLFAVLKTAVLFLVVFLCFNFFIFNILNNWLQLANLSYPIALLKMQFSPTGLTNNSQNFTIFKPLPRQYLCYRLMQRMGNHMFIFASNFGLAKEKNMILLSSKQQFSYFKMETKNNIIQYDKLKLCRKAKRYNAKYACRYDPSDKLFGNESVILLLGYLQSWKYFGNAEKDIRELYTFKPHIIQRAQSFLQGIKSQHYSNKTIPKTVIFVGIHVRRGDLVAATKGYTVAPLSYFLKAMAAFRKKFQHIIFVLATDSSEWCKENLPNTIYTTGKGTSAVLDMAILSVCNHTISSVGSYSWWAAWLANGIVTYYMPPAKEGSRLRKVFSEDFSDFFWPGWIPIRDEDDVDDIKI